MSGIIPSGVTRVTAVAILKRLRDASSDPEERAALELAIAAMKFG